MTIYTAARDSVQQLDYVLGEAQHAVRTYMARQQMPQTGVQTSQSEDLEAMLDAALDDGVETLVTTWAAADAHIDDLRYRYAIPAIHDHSNDSAMLLDRYDEIEQEVRVLHNFLSSRAGIDLYRRRQHHEDTRTYR